MVFHVSSNIPMECLKFGHWLWYCLCWCSLSFDISIRAEVSTLRKVVMTGHKQQPLMGRPGEWVLHTNMRIVNLSQSFGYLCSDPILQSNQNIKWSNSSTLRHLSGAVNPPSLHQMLHQVLSQTHPNLGQPKKNWLKIKRNQSKKKRLDVYIVLQLDLM